jgi:hypothetical protein
MRTTVDIPEELLQEAKSRAARSRSTLGQLIGDALRLTFQRTDEASQTPASLPTFRGTGVQPGVDIANNAALLDLMEKDDWSSAT